MCLASNTSMGKACAVLITAGAMTWTGGCSRSGLTQGHTPNPPADARSPGASGNDASGEADIASLRPDIQAGADWASDSLPADSDCIVAVRTDTCCSDPFAVFREDMLKDPCIQPYLSTTYSAACTAKQPPGCELVDCAFGLPPTRTAGRGPDGACQFISECASDGDCTNALDLRGCCGCPAVYPRALVATDPCLQDLAPGSASNCPSTTCGAVRCAQPACSPQVAICTSAGATAAVGLKVCGGDPKGAPPPLP
jgi:hypothetical protein